MDNILAARSQMAMSLAFHIIFAVIGIGMPLLMVIAEWRWLRSKDEVYLTLAKRWAKGTAILFAVGAVSGTVGCMAAMEVIKLIAGVGEPLAGTMLTMDLATMTFSRRNIHRNPDCVVCSEFIAKSWAVK